MKPILKACLLVLPLLSTMPLFPAIPALAGEPPLDTGMIPAPVTLLPDDDARALVVLLSGGSGWQASDQAEAERLQGNGAIVIGIDTVKYLAALSADKAAEKSDCIYMVSDIEELSHQLQRKAGNAAFLPPIIAGRGEGGALALAILAQTPRATIGQTLALDPEAGIPLARQLCTPAEKTNTGNRMQYALTDGDLPDTTTVLASRDAPRDGMEHVRSLIAKHPDIDLREIPDAPDTAFSATLDELIAVQSQSDSPLGMPLTILDTVATQDTIAVIYSGDGGWRDLDSEVATQLQSAGIPVVGVDSLRYFWSKRTPEETSRDLATIIHTYGKRWKAHHILLVGYSFGADILPAAFNGLPDKLKDRVAQISLLALSHQVDYEVSVSGWLGEAASNGAGDPLTDIARIEPSMIQCFYGADEEDDACRDLKGSIVETVELTGGHHFDGDYAALAKRITDGLARRTGH